MVLVHRKVSLGTALVLGAVVLGLWSGMEPLGVLECLALTLAAPRTILLSAVVGLILVLSHLMEDTGQMKRLVLAFEGISNNVRVNLTIFPALMGLLPMPGGAVFSAPMVDAMSKGQGLSATDKALINYWFRHLWEYCWPLYPGVVLACALGDISFGKFFLAMAPMTLLAICAGYLVLLVRLRVKNPPPPAKRTLTPLFKELAPVLIVVCGAGVLGAFSSIGANAGLIPRLPPEAPLIVALIAGIFWVVRVCRVDGKTFAKIFTSRAFGSMIYMVAGVMIFAGVMRESHSVEQISLALAAGNVPVALVAMLLPFIVGCVTGIAVAFVGATFPILYSLVHASGLSQDIMAYTILAYCSGYAGVLISPVHACLVLTYTYFNASLADIYKRLSILVSVIILGGIAGFFTALRVF